jgi:PAS domain S-box-containing protein
MVARLKAAWSRHLLQIKLITSESAEGVIMIDVNQAIKWANNAALSMHGVQSLSELGRTIDEYHANFQVKFRGALPASSDRMVESVAAGESFRDVIIEVTPLMGSRPQWIYRVRNLVLVDDAGNPTCIVLVMRPVQDDANVSMTFTGNLAALPTPAAIVRSADDKLLAANEGFLHLAGSRNLDSKDLPPCFGSISLARQGMDLTGSANDRAAAMVSDSEGEPDPWSAAILRMPVTYDNQQCVLCSLVEPSSSSTRPADHQVRNSSSTYVTPNALCEASPIPLLVLNDTVVVTAVSQAFLDWLSYSEEDVLGRGITSFMTPASADYFMAHTWPILAERTHVRDLKCEFIKKSGVVVPALVSGTAKLGETGCVSHVVLAPIDNADRVRSDDAFAAMFSLTPVPMLIRKLEDSRILDVNDAFVMATSLDTDSVVGRGMEEFGIFDNRVARAQFEAAARSEGGAKNVDGHLKTREGDILDCLISARKVQAFGQTCLLIVLQDVSDRRRNETQLFQAIETVMEDTSWFSRSVIEKLATLRSPPRSGSRAAEIGDLTPREREVLGFISHGLADTDIAQKLGLTRSTVRNHVATLYSKIGVHSRSSAIIWARERGINMAWPAAPAANYTRSPLTGGKAGLAAMVVKNRRA